MTLETTKKNNAIPVSVIVGVQTQKVEKRLPEQEEMYEVPALIVLSVVSFLSIFSAHYFF